MKVALFKDRAEKSYTELRTSYEQIKDVPNLSKTSKKMAKAQMTVHAGIYNRDYAMYKKGVDNFEKYSARAVVEASEPNKSIPIIETDDPSRYEGRQAPQSVFHERKLAFYKGLYNELPRGYFK